MVFDIPLIKLCQILVNHISPECKEKLYNDQPIYLAAILDAILSFSKCSMMPRWHQSDSSIVTSKQRESAKKKVGNAFPGQARYL